MEPDSSQPQALPANALEHPFRGCCEHSKSLKRLGYTQMERLFKVQLPNNGRFGFLELHHEDAVALAPGCARQTGHGTAQFTAYKEASTVQDIWGICYVSGLYEAFCGATSHA